MDAFFDIINEHQRGMGTISIFHEGNEIYTRSIGYTDIGSQRLNDANTRIDIGSITKTFIATVIMQMVEENKLSLDTKLSDFFPSVTNAEYITIKHLLKHQSGIFNYTNEEYLELAQDPLSKSELLNLIVEKEAVFAPGERYRYSNSGYVLLAMIAEQIDGRSLDRILNRRIIRPLRLRNTSVGGRLNTRRNEAAAHTFITEWIPYPLTLDRSGSFGAGGMVSTARDVNVFYTNLFAGRLVNKESLDLMKAVDDQIEADGRTRYGIGMYQIPFHDILVFGHTGDFVGYHAIAVYLPVENVAATYTSNGVFMPRNRILFGALNILFGKEMELPNFEQLQLARDILERYLGVYKNEDYPFTITVFLDGEQLMAQATDQSAFPLSAVDEYNFTFEPAGFRIEFKPEQNEMIIQQGGVSLVFSIIEEKE
jgi:CubicO group peptidase (beta-lactamase class C family)